MFSLHSNSFKILTPACFLILIVIFQYNGMVNGHSFRSLYCQFMATNVTDHCQHGHYVNECDHRACFKGLGESCGMGGGDELQFGKCAPEFTCFCGKCSGCENDHCRLELCKGHRFFDDKESMIKEPYFYY